MTLTDITAPGLIDRAIAVIDDDIARLTATRAQLTAARESLSGVAPEPVPASGPTGATPPPRTAPKPKPKPKPKRTVKRAATPKPTTAPAAPSDVEQRTKRTPSGKPDYRKIAEVMQQAKAAGRPIRTALVAEFAVPMTTANNWITKVYQLGLLDKSLPPAAEPATA